MMAISPLHVGNVLSIVELLVAARREQLNSEARILRDWNHHLGWADVPFR